MWTFHMINIICDIHIQLLITMAFLRNSCLSASVNLSDRERQNCTVLWFQTGGTLRRLYLHWSAASIEIGQKHTCKYRLQWWMQICCSLWERLVFLSLYCCAYRISTTRWQCFQYNTVRLSSPAPPQSVCVCVCMCVCVCVCAFMYVRRCV